MKIIIIKSHLKEALSAVERVAADSGGLPILKNALLEAVQNKITLIATNLEMAMRFFVSGKIIEEGKITVSASILSSLVSNIPSERLNLDSKDANLEIKTDSYKGNLLGSPAEDFPIIPKIKTSAGLKIKGVLLKDALTQVIPAAQLTDLRPELSSILFDYTLENLKLVATDSFRLAEKNIESSKFISDETAMYRALVPIKTISEVLRTTRDDEEVSIVKDVNQILFKTERYELISRLIESNFPDYNSIIPKEPTCEITTSRQELFEAVKIASILGSKNNEVSIKIPKSKKNIEVFSADRVVGENNYLLPAKVSGEAEKIVFNWRYLSDGLKAIKNEEIVIGLNQERPAIMKGTKDGSYFYIIAPILSS